MQHSNLLRLVVVTSLMLGLVGPAQALPVRQVRAQDASTLDTCVDYVITASSDDAVSSSSGTTISLTANPLQTYVSSDYRWWGLRFQSVAVPPGATITSAYLTFVAQATNANSGPVQRWWGNAVDDAVTFTATSGDVINRTKTTAYADWTMPAFTAGAAYSTTLLTTVVQEIVSRVGWSSGNDMAFLGQAQSGIAQNKAVYSWDYSGANEPALHICYAVGTTYDLTVAVDPIGGGTTSPSAGTHTYAENTVVDITATANTGYSFDQWTGDCSGSGACQVTMNATKAVTATFAALPQYTLTATDDGNGSVSLDPPGGTYYAGTTVTLTVTPADCYEFSGWSGANSGDIIDTAGVYTIVMDENKSVQADFSPLPQYTLTAGNDGNGSVTLDPAGGTYCTGTTVTLTPVPACAYAFDSWSGADYLDLSDNGDGTWSILMDGNKSVTANFAAAPLPYLDGAVSSNTADDVSSMGVSHTTGTCPDRLMLVGVSWNCGTNDRTISSVTFSYGARPTVLTLDLVRAEQTGTQFRYSAIYSLLNPPLGETGTVTVTFSGAVSNGIVAGIANFGGVDQTTPLGTPNGANGSSTAPSVDLTGLGGDELVFDNVFQGASGDTQTLTAGSGQERLWHEFAGNARGAASIERAAGSSVTMSWTAAASSLWAIVAVPINPAPPATGTIIVEKETGPDSDEDLFTFTGAATGSITAGQTIVVNDLAAGTYYVTETLSALADWSLTGIECSDANSVGDVAHLAAEFHLETGETVTCTFHNVALMDYGDAPDSYKTLLASDGARHWNATGRLGADLDEEVDGHDSALADGDDLDNIDDEDGVTLPAVLVAGDVAATVTVTLSPGYAVLDAWIDFDGNGVFDHPLEHLWGGTTHALPDASNVLTFAVPATATVGMTYARFRSSGSGGLAPFGRAADGEVEDYRVEIVAACYALTLGHSGNGADPVASPTNSTGCSAGSYHSGESIGLSGAAPDTGWEIASWTGTGDDASTGITNTLTMPASAHSADVNYVQTCYELTLGHTGNGADPVASPEYSEACVPKANAAATLGVPANMYVYGESITLSGATPDTGWHIAGWSGTDNDGSTGITNTLTMPASNHSAGVNYTQTCYELTLGHSGDGTDPTPSPANSDACGPGLSEASGLLIPAHLYVYGENITLSGATPGLGWGVASWYGTSDNNITDTTNSLVMPASDYSAGVNYLRLLGDVNLDGLVDSTDALIVLTADAGLPATAYCPMNYGDVNGDGLVNSTDALIILTYDVGFPVGGLPVAQPVAEPSLTEQPDGCGPAPTCYALTLGHKGEGSDPIPSPGNSDACDPGYYVAGESISLSGATPGLDFYIGGWYGTDNDGWTSSTNYVTMPASDHDAGVEYKPYVTLSRWFRLLMR